MKRYRKMPTLFILLLAFSIAIWSDLHASATEASASDSVVVQYEHETSLRTLARQHLGDANLWSDILSANQIGSLIELKPGMKLTIPVAQILAVEHTLAATSTTLKRATAEGARLLATERVNSAQEAYDKALKMRQKAQWDASMRLGSDATALALAAIKESKANRYLKVQARLERSIGQVQLRKPEDNLWQAALDKALLNERDKLRTLSKASADVLFRDESLLRLGANSEIVIEMSRRDRLRKRNRSDVVLYAGEIYAMLNSDKASSGVKVQPASLTTTIRSREYWMDQQENRTLIANYQGEFEVGSGNKTVVLKKNQGTLVETGQAPVDPLNLLVMPTLLQPKRYAVNYTGLIDMRWSAVAMADHYWLEIARDAEFNTRVAEQRLLNKTEHQLQLADDAEEGLYFWRVAAVDKNGLPGPKSRAFFFRLQRDTEAPYLMAWLVGDKKVVTQDSIEIQGKTETAARVKQGDHTIDVAEDGTFSFRSSLVEGANSIRVEAMDRAGNRSEKTLSIAYIPKGEQPLSYGYGLHRLEKDHLLVGDSNVSLLGKTLPNIAIHLKEQESQKPLATAQSDENGGFSLNFTLSGNSRALLLEAVTPSGQRFERPFKVTLDTEPPAIEITPPASLTSEPNMVLSGKVVAAEWVAVNGDKVNLDDTGLFTHTLPLISGSNTLKILAEDAVGNRAQRQHMVVLDQRPPRLLDSKIEETLSKGRRLLTLTLKVAEEHGLKAGVPFRLRVGGRDLTGTLRLCPGRSCYKGQLLLPPNTAGKVNLYPVTLEDRAGNRSENNIE